MFKGLLTSLLILFYALAIAQGPPLLTDKPLMLGEHQFTVQLLGQYGNYHHVDFTALSVRGSYNLSSKIQVNASIPVVYDQNFAATAFGDISIGGKYQLYQNNKTGRTFRVAAKYMHTFATGRDIEETNLVGLGYDQDYFGLVAGYENIKIGIIGEVGYNFISENIFSDDLSYRLTIGIPFLKSTYPVKQITLYLESLGVSTLATGENALYMGPVLQYAINQFTFDLGFQLPVYQQVDFFHHINFRTFYFGSRVIF